MIYLLFVINSDSNNPLQTVALWANQLAWEFLWDLKNILSKISGTWLGLEVGSRLENAGSTSEHAVVHRLYSNWLR